MGVDVSILFAARRLPMEILQEQTRAAFREEHPDHLVVLYGHDGPGPLAEAFPEFTAFSLWADEEISPEPVAAAVSRVAGPVLVITMADHANVGAWHVFEKGRLREGEWLEENYTDGGVLGFAAAYGVTPNLDDEERASFVEDFLNWEMGVCVFGDSGTLKPGRPLAAADCLAIMERDFEDAALECMLME